MRRMVLAATARYRESCIFDAVSARRYGPVQEREFYAHELEELRWLHAGDHAVDHATDEAAAVSREAIRLRMLEVQEVQAAQDAWMSRVEAEPFHAADLVPWWREAIRSLAARDTCTGA